jgi:hypothetical protein
MRLARSLLEGEELFRLIQVEVMLFHIKREYSQEVIVELIGEDRLNT